MVAWKLITNFDKQKHLLNTKIKTNYIIETYICSCGHIEFIVNHSEHLLNYTCDVCENTKFHNANNAWNNLVNFMYMNFEDDFSYEYHIEGNNEIIRSLYTINIPHNIDFLNKKVIYEKEMVYSLSLSITGEFKEKYLLRFDENIASNLQNNLIKNIEQNNSFNIPISSEKNLTIAIAEFFLKNKHLKAFNFYFWTNIDQLPKSDIKENDALEFISNYPKSKSVKRAVYKNYIKQLEDTDKFDSRFIEVFCKNIKDVNILSKLLELKLYYSLYSDITVNELDKIVVFLKQYYSDKQLLKFFSSEEFISNDYLFRDAMQEFLYAQKFIKNSFKKVTCKLEAIHDEFIRCTKEERYKNMQHQILTYSMEVHKPCVDISGYQIKLPKNGKDLFNWANELHNCMAGYFEMINDQETIIYCFFHKNVLNFAVEICNNKIVQASGKYNSGLTAQENQVLTKWYALFFKNKNIVAKVA